MELVSAQINCSGFIKEAKIVTDEKGRTVSLVEFDIALANADSKDTKGGIGVFRRLCWPRLWQGASHGETSSEFKESESFLFLLCYQAVRANPASNSKRRVQ